MKKFEEYKRKFEEFSNINDLNIGVTSNKIIGEKHYWVCQLIETKINKDKLERDKKILVNKFAKDKVATGILSPDKMKITEDLVKDEDINRIIQEIKECEFLIEYLTHIVKFMTFISQDIKNIIEIKKLQET